MMPLAKQHFISDVWKDGMFKNKVVFCTGGAGTICSAQVRALVYLGADACIIGRNEKKTEHVARDIATARQGAKVLGIGGVDVRRLEALEDAVARCIEELGGLDFVIAGAAGNFLAPISQLSSNAFKSVVDIDLLGSYNTLKATISYLIDSATKNKSDSKTAPPSGTGGRIVFISATIHYTGIPLQAHVAAAKAGVDALSNVAALEFGPHGVTSNVIAPGPIAGTEGMERLAKQEAHASSQKSIPLGRWGTVKEIADATVYLFSDAANFVTGQTLVVDGAAWRAPLSSPSTGFDYPDFLLSGEVVSGVKGGKQSKL